MSLSTTNAVVLSRGFVLAKLVKAEVLAWVVSFPASEAWDISVDQGNSVPPFPVIVDLIVEPNGGASSNGNVSSPGGIEVLLDHCVSCVHILVCGNWNCGINLPGVDMSFGLGIGT